jgi:hypothetical protein
VGEYSDLELISFRDVWFTRQRRPGVSDDFHVRRIMREYSQKFHTPLHVVYELPLHFVMRAWLEDVYENMKDEDMVKEARALTQDQDALMAARRAEDASDADMWLFKKDLERGEAAAKKLEDAVKAIGQVTSGLKQLAQRPMTHEERMVGARMDKEVQLTNVKVVPGQQIKIQFADIDLDAVDGFGLLEDPKPPTK